MTVKPDKYLEVHLAAQFFALRSGASAIVVLTNKPEKLAAQYAPHTTLYVATGRARLLKQRQASSKLLPDAKFMASQRLSAKFLEDKVLVVIDYLEEQNSSPLAGIYRRCLRSWHHKSLLSIVSVKQTRSWSLEKLSKWLGADPQQLLGRSKLVYNLPNRNQLVAIGGKLADYKLGDSNLAKVLAVVIVFNERDIIAATIKHLLDQGVDVHVVDNWSTDGSYEIVEALTADNPKRVSYERYPEKPIKTWQWFKLLSQVTRVASERKKYDWIMLNDADELRWSPWKGVTLQQAFSFVDRLGYNSVDYTVFAFNPVSDGFSEANDPDQFFGYGEFPKLEAYFIQVKSWRNNPAADLASSGGHLVQFPDQKIFPLKFFLSHYPLRSNKQAYEKVFKNRQPRLHKAERDKGWNVHYDDIPQDKSFIVGKKGLAHYASANFGQDYLLVRLAGIGIKKRKP